SNISTLPSDETSSDTITSKEGPSWAKTDDIVCSRNGALLYDIMTTVTSAIILYFPLFLDQATKRLHASMIALISQALIDGSIGKLCIVRCIESVIGSGSTLRQL